MKPKFLTQNEKPLVVLAVGFSLTVTANAAIEFLENPPSMSNGEYLFQQQLSFDGTEISWATGSPGGTPGFIVQAFEDFGEIYLNFGSWNTGPYEVTTNALTLDVSVSAQTLWQGQRQIIQSAPITNQYYGVRYFGAGNYHYGWINLSTISAFEAGRINAVAFNTELNSDILVGQTAIPEPEACAVLTGLAVLAGIAVRRRRILHA